MSDFECCAVAAEHRPPRWLAGLIARHGEPLIVRRVYDMSTDLEYEWPDRIVRVGESWGTHFVVAARRGGRVVNLGGLDHQPTDADISGVVALAGLCDAASRCDTCGGNSVIACHGAYPGGPTACIDCHGTGEMTCPDCRSAPGEVVMSPQRIQRRRAAGPQDARS